MTTRTQGLVLAVLAAVLIRLSVTGEYLRFVTPWMRWPLMATGAVLLAMAARPALFSTSTRRAAAPRSAWLLLLPTLVVFAVAPPPLGAFLAERRADQPTSPDRIVAPLPESDDPLPLSVGEFVWGASQPDDSVGLAGQRVAMTGFVSRGKEDSWFLTMLEISCCAADAMVSRVRISGHDSPPRDQWVEITGTWVEGTGQEPGLPATLEAEQVVEIDAPREVYG